MEDWTPEAVRNGLADKPHLRFWSQIFGKKVRLICKSLRDNFSSLLYPNFSCHQCWYDINYINLQCNYQNYYLQLLRFSLNALKHLELFYPHWVAAMKEDNCHVNIGTCDKRWWVIDKKVHAHQQNTQHFTRLTVFCSTKSIWLVQEYGNHHSAFFHLSTNNNTLIATEVN